MRARYEVVVVGGGHAGAEAAAAAARLGRRTLLLTRERAALGRMSCNPAIGGLAKGQVVREIDALGGLMAHAADRTGIQFKVLNASRGPAVQGLRCQSDRIAYAAEVSELLSRQPSLTIAEGTAAGFLVRGGRLAGLRLEDGSELLCSSVVVTSGTFLRGLVHIGERREEAGRWGEAPCSGLSESLRALGLRLGRMKTGTPPRVHRESIDRSKLLRSAGDGRPRRFSLRSRIEPFPLLPQVDCWLSHTNERTHDLIRANLGRSPLYSGRIVGRGPRYCPSIEDKVVRFPDRERHTIFIEPEGHGTDWTYLGGLSMSLPVGLQLEVVRSLPGLERAEILRPAYAVEYDVVFPEQLEDSLETRALPGLFLAGQVNGTSGYEEAAGQGLVAGANAALVAGGRIGPPFTLGRHEAYIGVMIDDLVTLGADEPYRLLTSRAEHRLLLGAESAYARLVPRAIAAGLLPEKEAEPLLEREARQAAAREALGQLRVVPDRETVATLDRLSVTLAEESTGAGLLRRPDAPESLRGWLEERLPGLLGELDEEEWSRLVNDLRYEGFLRRERESLERVRRAEEKRIPAGFRYAGIPGLSAEAAEKLERHRPRTLGQAARIPGVTAAAVTLLLARLAVRGGEAAA
ncbi:MAG TPA: tRNA uridine-5-carboxymethylaminomethyl(34) synthesis enzyme MnmG [Thermoanaerobaculia bacterium]|jgi:tRNA uridine 5-carboxymethylaminomethyl modification enzyme|nr:tRNA uridine-5-carboxymethylaminomethyl(34) synthesis enzyme MnmG [Thermoanaerobaculia bacterium]HPA53083.1 tRNA uridine-5-carboxymethylaminomethyl(34) synthesis enzyme MnmG [Thermoanaerobaculia bacterium]HQN08704.1 tRNA uridine-5-carboxymethylaminomethyl(34) synthesis enzyme MnmG [Thermoanaerobaculia bacterium]HQP87818.1 tRNA uridine-5-carboxymethylaminomethyl(34) synthesis enzyme MnmG [Thermoanaerobaculia bacterium]